MSSKSSTWNNVKKEHILKAITEFDKGLEKYKEARNTILLYTNKRYPAKHIRGMAYKIANGAPISKNDYAGGQETVNFFIKQGFSVEYKGKIYGAANSNHQISSVHITEGNEKETPKKIKLDVIEQKNVLQKLIQKHYGVIETEKKYAWLKTPDPNSIPADYQDIVEDSWKISWTQKFF